MERDGIMFGSVASDNIKNFVDEPLDEVQILKRNQPKNNYESQKHFPVKNGLDNMMFQSLHDSQDEITYLQPEDIEQDEYKFNKKKEQK